MRNLFGNDFAQQTSDPVFLCKTDTFVWLSEHMVYIWEFVV